MATGIVKRSKSQSITLKDVDQGKFVKAFALFLRKSGKVELPEWIVHVKTGKAKELAPYDPDWYYTRCAAVLRHMYHRSPVGVGALTKIYGHRKDNGVLPDHVVRGSGSLARRVLQTLDKLKMCVKTDAGRELTSAARRDIDRIAARVYHIEKKKAALRRPPPVVPKIQPPKIEVYEGW